MHSISGFETENSTPARIGKVMPPPFTMSKKNRHRLRAALALRWY